MRNPKAMHMEPVVVMPAVKHWVTPRRGSRCPNRGEERKTTSSKTPNTKPYSVDVAPCKRHVN